MATWWTNAEPGVSCTERENRSAFSEPSTLARNDAS